MESEKKRGRPCKEIPEPSSDADLTYIRMYNQYISLKKAQSAYYQRTKAKKAENRLNKIMEETGQRPRLGRPPKKNENETA